MLPALRDDERIREQVNSEWNATVERMEARIVALEAALDERPTRCDQYRDLLETWTQWWNNVGRANFTHYILPPLTETGHALACDACKGVGWYEAQDSPVDRCQVCGRRLP